MRRPLAVLTAVTFVTWVGSRLTAVALPLVALAETGDAWTTGLVGGTAGLPLVTVGWWGRPLRDRLTSGRTLAAVLLLQAAGVALVPAATATVGLGPVALCVSGLVAGSAAALLGPAERALVADLADAGVRAGSRVSPARWLAWQDLAHRVSMIFAPPLGAWLVTAWGAAPLLWCESAAMALGAVALLAVPAARTADAPAASAREDGPAPSMRHVLRSHPEVAAGVVLAGVGGLVWFAFSLGLAILGAQLDRPGALVAAGMTGYGAASVAMSFVVPLVVDRLPRTATIAVSWTLLGAAFAVLPLVAPDLVLIGVVAAVGGAAMPWGIAALNALISEQTSGAERRAAFTAETVLHSGGASLGLLLGGGVIGALGAEPVLVAAGVVQVVAALAGVAWLSSRRAGPRPPDLVSPQVDALRR